MVKIAAHQEPPHELHNRADKEAKRWAKHAAETKYDFHDAPISVVKREIHKQIMNEWRAYWHKEGIPKPDSDRVLTPRNTPAPTEIFVEQWHLLSYHETAMIIRLLLIPVYPLDV